jgi:hypothetical protein
MFFPDEVRAVVLVDGTRCGEEVPLGRWLDGENDRGRVQCRVETGEVAGGDLEAVEKRGGPA